MIKPTFCSHAGKLRCEVGAYVVCQFILKSFVKIDYQAKTQLQHNHSRHTAQITALSALLFRPPYSVYPFCFNKT